MVEPKKISDQIRIRNGYLKIHEKKFINEYNEVSNFLITSHDRQKTIGVFILPITTEGEIIYLKEYRYGPEKIVINFPVGMLEDGESPIDRCAKELAEETGYHSANIQLLGKSIIENYFEGEIWYFLAKDCEKYEQTNHEASEKIEVLLATVPEFERMILNGEVQSSKTGYCFFLADKKHLLK